MSYFGLYGGQRSASCAETGPSVSPCQPLHLRLQTPDGELLHLAGLIRLPGVPRGALRAIPLRLVPFQFHPPCGLQLLDIAAQAKLQSRSS
jgi:hypothetical protein